MFRRRQNHRPAPIAAVLLAAALAAGATSQSAAHGDDKDDRVVRIMTQNVYEGTNYEELAAATNFPEFLAAVTATFQGIAATNPAERAADIAREIARHKPDLVGLQEVSIARTGAAPPVTTVVSDLLQLIRDELVKQKQNYVLVAIVPKLDAEAPSSLGTFFRITGQDAILARKDPDLKLSNVQVKNFATNLVFPSVAGPITFKRGWASVDVRKAGHTFRFATTHLDPVVPLIRLAQANEVIQGLGTDLPVIVVGDFNAVPNDASDPTYQTFQLANFDDAWALRRPFDPGFTCCQDGDLKNAKSLLSTRVDWILFRGKFRGDFHVLDAELIGEKRNDRTPSGLWPSDHAGVVAKLRLPHRHHHHNHHARH
jgi:endonuclease/exonuclease/phosphatase family metal-dependent hydrolase